MPEGFKLNMANSMSKVFCSDTQFIKCIGINLKGCDSHVRNAVENCDCRPMWNEFERIERTEKKLV